MEYCKDNMDGWTYKIIARDVLAYGCDYSCVVIENAENESMGEYNRFCVREDHFHEEFELVMHPAGLQPQREQRHPDEPGLLLRLGTQKEEEVSMNTHHKMSSEDMALALERYGKECSKEMLQAVADRLLRNAKALRYKNKRLEELEEGLAKVSKALSKVSNIISNQDDALFRSNTEED